MMYSFNLWILTEQVDQIMTLEWINGVIIYKAYLLIHFHQTKQQQLHTWLTWTRFAIDLEVWSLKSEVGSPKSKVGTPKSEVGSRKSEVGSPKSEVRSRKSEVPPRLSYL